MKSWTIIYIACVLLSSILHFIFHFELIALFPFIVNLVAGLALGCICMLAVEKIGARSKKIGFLLYIVLTAIGFLSLYFGATQGIRKLGELNFENYKMIIYALVSLLIQLLTYTAVMFRSLINILIKLFSRQNT